MSEAAIAGVGLLLLLWAVGAGWLARHDITGPIVFVVAGYVFGNPDWGPLTVDVEATTIHAVAEVTLALVLFADAARINTGDLRHDIALPGRLLVVALPLVVLLGSLLALGMFPEFPWALAAFVGAALAPTDAALSSQVINDEGIPERWRRTLNVESGLNDGIATPIVVLMLAVAATQLGVAEGGGSFQTGEALVELSLGVVVGLGGGLLGGRLLLVGSRLGGMQHGGRRLATVATAVTAFATAGALNGNGFVAAFVGGITFGAVVGAGMAIEKTMDLTELGGELLALVVWFVFGAALVPPALASLDVVVLTYALASLTVVRILPVALSLLGSGLDRRAVATLGWFGPRGLASVVFAILAVEELDGGGTAVARAVGTVTLTILLSVLLHGASASPWSRRLQTQNPQRSAPEPGAGAP